MLRIILFINFSKTNSEAMALYENPPDGGMLYAETNLQHLFPEPLNTVTSCFFLAIAIYWTFRLRGKTKQHIFLSVAVALLYVGGIGGTIYHGMRQWHFFIMMDWLPIMLLCVAAGVYFLGRVTKWYFAVAFVVVYIVFQFFARGMMREAGNIQLFININYAVLGSMVLLPVLAFLITTKFRYGNWVGFAFLAFIAALTFRVVDGWQLTEFGTHFLWHSFGAVAAFCMFQYIYMVNEKESDPQV